MIKFKPRIIPPRAEWQLEQQGLPPLLARLYAARGIKSRHELDYGLSTLIPPAQLTHAKTAAILLADAIEAQARMLIVADYDCDGATACAVGIRALRAMSISERANIDYLVPSRFTYGYGLTPEIVDLAAQKEPDLIITVDNGISSIEGVARAKERGIATLITDHHLPTNTLPDADCIVNPNQPECSFPSKGLAGVGVMFYVMLALRSELRKRNWFSANNGVSEPNLAALLDLVALGTIADVVALDHNNRLLVNQGLKRIREGKMTLGLNALFRLAGCEPSRATGQDLGFIIGPRLNAAGRLTDMAIGIECLITDDPLTALALAQQLEGLNRKRKNIESEMQEKALDYLENMQMPEISAVAFFDPKWHQGVIGILASRLKDQLYRPAFAFAPGDDDQIKGSGRSIPGLNLRDLLELIEKDAPGMILKFGGHAMAAGVTIREEDFPRFSELFARLVAKVLLPEDLAPILLTDGPLETSYVSINTVRLLENEIWGEGFEAPLFDDIFIVENQRILKNKHLKLRLTKDGKVFDAILFNSTQPLTERIHAAYHLAINSYNGMENVQLIIKHINNHALSGK